MSEERADLHGRRVWPAALAVSGDLVEQLNTWWRIAGPAPIDAPLQQRLTYRLRRWLARLLGPQETFNSTVVQHLNAINATLTTQQPKIEARLDDVLSTALERSDAALDEVRRYHEALAARERRIEAAMTGLRADHQELRTSIGVLQQATHTLTRELASRPTVDGQPDAASGPHANPPAGSRPPSSDALTHKYVGFEDQFRGTPEAIRAGLAEYLPVFAGTSDVLDIGCGRGEFLALLGEQGVRARGIDLNEAMVEGCRAKGLDASKADALTYLADQPDGSIGGLIAAQVVEHLEPAYLTQFLDVAFDKLRPGAPIVLETINPACWFAFFESYIRDITHVRPLHPDTLKFLLVATGFQQVDIRYRAPYPEHEKLQPVPDTVLGDTAETLNANVDKINRLLFTHLDYAAIARRP